MGINSDVLNTKTANVRPIKGNQEVNEFFNCIIIKRVIYGHENEMYNVGVEVKEWEGL